MPITPSMINEAMPKKVTAISVKVDKKPMTFKLPKNYKSEDDGDVKEALLKFKENPDGTCEMISLDGAPFKDDMKEEMDDEMGQEQDMGGADDEMPADMPMEDAIGALQKRDRNR